MVKKVLQGDDFWVTLGIRAKTKRAIIALRREDDDMDDVVVRLLQREKDWQEQELERLQAQQADRR